MKKILALALTSALILSSFPVASATQSSVPAGEGTVVEYVGEGKFSYSVTVPAQLNPGQSGTVTLAGSWSSNDVVSVTADKTVTLTSNIMSTDTKTLDISFAGIVGKGNNTSSQAFVDTVSVADIEDALFGTWSGRFNYYVNPSFNVEEELSGYHFWSAAPIDDMGTVECDGNKITLIPNEAMVEDIGGPEEFAAMLQQYPPHCNFMDLDADNITATEVGVNINWSTWGLEITYAGPGLYYLSLGSNALLFGVQPLPIEQTPLKFDQKYVLDYSIVSNVPVSVIPRRDGTADFEWEDGTTATLPYVAFEQLIFCDANEFILSDDGCYFFSIDNTSEENVTVRYVVEDGREQSCILHFESDYYVVYERNNIESELYNSTYKFHKDGSVTLTSGGTSITRDSGTCTYSWKEINTIDGQRGEIDDAACSITLFDPDGEINAILHWSGNGVRIINDTPYRNNDNSYVVVTSGYYATHAITVYNSDGTVQADIGDVFVRGPYVFKKTTDNKAIPVGLFSSDGTVFSLYDISVPSRDIVGTFILE